MNPAGTTPLRTREIEGLPEELLKELSSGAVRSRASIILEQIDLSGGVTSLDRLLVAIFRATGRIEKRSNLVSKLHRMAALGQIHKHPNRNGIYSTAPFDVTGGEQS